MPALLVVVVVVVVMVVFQESDSHLVCVLILQRQQRLQKERLMNDFSTALNNFQAVQRRVSEKEKETVARARAGSRISVSISGNFGVIWWALSLQGGLVLAFQPHTCLLTPYWVKLRPWCSSFPFQVLEVISHFSVLQCQCRGGKQSW